MSTDTTTTAPAAPAADRSVEWVERLLKLPEQVRLDLGNLLLDSVREGFTSLAESEKRDKELIQSRLDELMSGNVELLTMDDVSRRIKERLAEVRKQ